MAFIEFHLLQHYAPANLNRDDTNTPKTCRFGGYRRGRISSQCQKRQIRLHPAFKQRVLTCAGDLGVRTKRLPLQLKEALRAQIDNDDQCERLIENLLKCIKLKVAKEKHFKTQYILYLGQQEIDELKALVCNNIDGFSDYAKIDKTLVKSLKDIVVRDSYAADIALFGRMVADNKQMNVDAACQVAHAISTHELHTDMDFFTAVDDLLREGEQGSDMMGTVFFNSACYYRYAQINLPILHANLNGDIEQLIGAVTGFYAGLLQAQPSGKQNSFAAHNPPSYIKVALRDQGAPWALTNAFIRPIRPDNNPALALDQQSILALEDYEQRLKRLYGTDSFVFEGCAHCVNDINLASPLYASVNELEQALGDCLRTQERLCQH